MGYIRGFLHGAVTGAVVGVCVAPQPGDKTRQQLAGFGRAAREGYDVAQRTVKQVAPYVSGAANLAKDQIARTRSSDNSPVTVEGNVRVHNGNGKY